jgi:hypothetical protein
MAMPFAPTDPSAASGAFPWAPPTADSSAEVQQPQQGAGVGDSPTAYAVPGLSGGAAYFTPRASRPTFQPPTSYDSFTTQQARLSIGARANRAAGGSPLLDTPKPFSDYDQPAAVSPYMELGRISSYAGDIDNYSQFVKPQLERQRASQQVGSQIRQLQTNVRALNTETQSLRGVRIPQYFMDYGGYYPALSR